MREVENTEGEEMRGEEDMDNKGVERRWRIKEERKARASLSNSLRKTSHRLVAVVLLQTH